MISLIIDGAIALVALIIIVRHTRLGFIKSILGSFKPIIAGVLAFVFRVPVAKLFVKLLTAPITSWAYASLSASASGAEPSFDLVSLYTSCPIVYTKGLAFFGLNVENGFHDKMMGISQLDEAGLTELSTEIGSAMCWGLSLGIALLAIFVVALILLSLITTLLDAVTRLAVLNVVNKLLGAAVGLFWSIAFALVVGFVLTMISNIVPNVVGEAIIMDSIILGTLADLNISGMIPGISA